MNHLKKIRFLLVFSFFSVQLQAEPNTKTACVEQHAMVAKQEESADPNNHNADFEDQDHYEQDEPAHIVYFFTQEDDIEANKPSGQYWPAQDQHYVHHKKEINSASAYIGENSYSDVTQSLILQEEKKHHYLGHFKDHNDDKIIYLYGTKDTYTPNDAEDEVNENDDNDEEIQEDIDIFDT